jgi:hypothetical protein
MSDGRSGHEIEGEEDAALHPKEHRLGRAVWPLAGDAARSGCLSLKVIVERHEGDRRRKGGAVHPELLKDAGKAPMTAGKHR